MAKKEESEEQKALKESHRKFFEREVAEEVERNKMRHKEQERHSEYR